MCASSLKGLSLDPVKTGISSLGMPAYRCYVLSWPVGSSTSNRLILCLEPTCKPVRGSVCNCLFCALRVIRYPRGNAAGMKRRAGYRLEERGADGH